DPLAERVGEARRERLVVGLIRVVVELELALDLDAVAHDREGPVGGAGDADLVAPDRHVFHLDPEVTITILLAAEARLRLPGAAVGDEEDVPGVDRSARVARNGRAAARHPGAHHVTRVVLDDNPLVAWVEVEGEVVPAPGRVPKPQPRPAA